MDFPGLITPGNLEACNSGMELSFAEELIWRAEDAGPEASPFLDCARNLWLILRLQGLLDQKALRSSIDAVVRRHEALRSGYVTRQGQPARVTIEPPAFNFTQIERQGLSPEEQNNFVVEEVVPQLERDVNLAPGPLLRTTLPR